MGLPQKIGGDTLEQAHNKSRGAEGSEGEAEGPASALVFIHFFNIPLQVLLQRDGHCALLIGRL